MIVPLGLLAFASLVVHQMFEGGGFFINLSTEVVGIIVTVAYVDWLIRKHEREQWVDADQRITERLTVFTNALISGFRVGLGFGPDILDIDMQTPREPQDIHREVMRVGREVLKPSARNRLGRLDQEGWKALIRQLNYGADSCTKMMTMFESRLTPHQYRIFLDLQQELSNSLIFYMTFPEMAGTPDDELPETRTPAIFLKQHGYDSTAEALRNCIDLVLELDETLRE